MTTTMIVDGIAIIAIGTEMAAAIATGVIGTEIAGVIAIGNARQSRRLALSPLGYWDRYPAVDYRDYQGAL